MGKLVETSTETGEKFLKRLGKHVYDIFCCNCVDNDWQELEEDARDNIEIIIDFYKLNYICETEASREIMELLDRMF